MPDSRRRPVRSGREALQRLPAGRALGEMHLDQRELGEAEPPGDVRGGVAEPG
jgi:hypothetical protein